MISFLNKFFHRQKKAPRSKGQVAVILVLVIAVLFIFFAVVLNLGKVAQIKTQVTIASNITSAYMASQIAGYAEYLYHYMGGPGEIDSGTNKLTVCKHSSIFVTIISFVIVIVISAIVTLITAGTAGFVSAFLLPLIISTGATLLTIGLQALVIEPGISDQWNKIQVEMNLDMPDRVLEQGVQIGLQNIVNDNKMLTDTRDFDQDGIFHWGAGAADKDEIGRFAIEYTNRLQSFAEDPGFADTARVSDFINVLKEFLQKGGDNWGLWDPVPLDDASCASDPHACCDQATRPAECDCCCLPVQWCDHSYTACPCGGWSWSGGFTQQPQFNRPDNNGDCIPDEPNLRPACCEDPSRGYSPDGPSCGSTANCPATQWPWVYDPLLEDERGNPPGFSRLVPNSDPLKIEERRLAVPLPLKNSEPSLVLHREEEKYYGSGYAYAEEISKTEEPLLLARLVPGPVIDLCGNGRCDAGENCGNCPEDCRPCPIVCGDGLCDDLSGEDCTTCSRDCGTCTSCGDGVCDPGEDCTSCSADCGACAVLCPNGACDPGETCSSCPVDCGACPKLCGNGVCNVGETNATCPADCISISSVTGFLSFREFLGRDDENKNLPAGTGYRLADAKGFYALLWKGTVDVARLALDSVVGFGEQNSGTSLLVPDAQCYNPVSDPPTWKKGFTRFCSTQWPYDVYCPGQYCDSSCNACIEDSLTCPINESAACPDNGGEFWPGDAIDQMRYGDYNLSGSLFNFNFNNIFNPNSEFDFENSAFNVSKNSGLDAFIVAANELIRTDPDELVKTLTTWYPKITSWWDNPATSSPNDGVLKTWMDAMEEWKTSLENWRTALYPNNGGLCPMSGGSTCNNNGTCDSTEGATSCPADCATIPAIINCLGVRNAEAIAAGDTALAAQLAARRDFLSSLLTETQFAIDTLNQAIQKFDDFLNDQAISRLNDEYNNVIAETQDGTRGLSPFAIYAWQSEARNCNRNGSCDKGEGTTYCPLDCPPLPGGGSCNNDGVCDPGERRSNCPSDCSSDGIENGYWHIIRVEVKIPGRCGGECGRKSRPGFPGGLPEPRHWPRFDTFTTGFLGSSRCTTLGDNFYGETLCDGSLDWDEEEAWNCFLGGTTKARITRYDEDRDWTVEFANKIPIWKFLFSHPSRSHSVTPGNIQSFENVCRSEIHGGAFMLNKKTNASCYNAAVRLLETGVMSKSCTEYFFHQSNTAIPNGFNVKFFSPCEF